MAKTAHDFQMSFVAFQRAQQASAEKQRTVVEGVKLAVHEDEAQYVVLLSYIPSLSQHKNLSVNTQYKIVYNGEDAASRVCAHKRNPLLCPALRSRS